MRNWRGPAGCPLSRHPARRSPRFAGYYQGLACLPRKLRRALQRRWRRSLGGIALLCAFGQAPALAATISVGGVCTLVDAITAANTDAPLGLSGSVRQREGWNAGCPSCASTSPRSWSFWRPSRNLVAGSLPNQDPPMMAHAPSLPTAWRKCPHPEPGDASRALARGYLLPPPPHKLCLFFNLRLDGLFQQRPVLHALRGTALKSYNRPPKS
jgi:hypothetical protein